MTTGPQHTLCRPVSAQGIGLFTGETVSLTLLPAPAGHGIVFERVDLPGSLRIAAVCDSVRATPLCTVLGAGDVRVQTVEHLLAALRAYDLDNVLIQMTGSEVPIFDGSSKAFISLIEQAGVQEMEEEIETLSLKEPLYWSEGNVHLIALPANEYKISYTLHYPHCPVIGSQFYSFSVTKDRFVQEIAPCRTFSIYEEIAPMIEKGLIKGGCLDSAVLVKEGVIANPEGLRFQDEMARHKVLDLIGDCSLLPKFVAHIVAVCSGHTSNHQFGKKFLNYVKGEC
ncbi:MAG: UDP-3-O-[3-hydroxymyristoyl] N-acetylglucosamine deacetylase [Chlamydiia bacterium]|nr:UDP-3-O-[3-hydroxymyristoyl] N-acetylglucosamine deacetylase [Chlamydiia bacterium]